MKTNQMRRRANLLLEVYHVDITNFPIISVHRNRDSAPIFFAQGEEAESILRDTKVRKNKILTQEQSIILFLESAGVIQ